MVWTWIHVAFEGVGDGADVMDVIRGAPKALFVEAGYLAVDIEIHGGDPEPAVYCVESTGRADIKPLRGCFLLSSSTSESAIA